MNRSLGAAQWVGFFFVGAAGVLLHFAFDWSGQSIMLAPFSAVNESIWEHMKLLYWPSVLFALAEGRWLGRQYRRFAAAKLCGISLGLVLIPVLFYTYTGISGQMMDCVNISIFFLAAGTAFLTEYRLLRQHSVPHIPFWLAWGLLGLWGAAFAALTFLPPAIPLFCDPVTGTYGFFAQ